jgi:hypothetical protein
LHAEVAGKTGTVDPLVLGLVMPFEDDIIHTYLDADMVTNIDFSDEFTTSNNDTSTLVTTNKRKFGWQGPVAVQCVEICVADTGVLDIDENLIGSRLGDGNLLVLEWTASLLDNLSPLHLGDLRSRHNELNSSWSKELEVKKWLCSGEEADYLNDVTM